MTRRIAVLAALAGSLLVLAAAALAAVAVKVTPITGGRSATFTVSFTSPTKTGVVGSKRLQDEILANARVGLMGCREAVQVTLKNLRKGQRVRAALTAPNWCAGTYNGRLVQLQSAVCPPGSMCPQYIRLTTLGRFSFTVH
jgi:hypothetical protein